jgi:hypothetical protein
MPYTFYVHHGTSWDNAKKIAQDGFKPSREKGSYLGAGVYAGDKERKTKQHASQRARAGTVARAVLPYSP